MAERAHAWLFFPLPRSLALARARDSLAGVGLRKERVVVGILRVPALAGDSRGRAIDCAPVTFAAALVALGCFRHTAHGGRLCGTAGRMRRGEGKTRGGTTVGAANPRVEFALVGDDV